MCYVYVCVCACAIECVRAHDVDAYNMQWFNAERRNCIQGFKQSHVGVLSGLAMNHALMSHTIWDSSDYYVPVMAYR